MKENVKIELGCLNQMVKNWCRGFLSWCSEGADNKWVVQELRDDIRQHITPYIKRFIEVEHITFGEAKTFWGDIYSLVDKFAEETKNIKEEKPVVDIQKLYNQFSVHSDLVQGGNCDNETVTNQKLKIAEIALTLIPALMRSQCTCGGDVIDSKCGGCDGVG